MISFLLYLFETGLCLSVLYLVYVLFFRKETYFNFNRFYLICILVFSLIIPVIHISFHVSSIETIEESVGDIGKFRGYYTNLIAKTDPEYTASPYIKYKAAIFEENDLYSNSITSNIVEQNSNNNTNRSTSYTDNSVNIAKIIILIYLTGVALFLVRLIFLVWSLLRIIKKNTKTYSNGYTIILLNEDIPPFSFFKYIFINKEVIKLDEYEQILAHEKTHVEQRHSFDLFLAHGITVFQWFNPLVWQLQKAIKTTHEYIADSKVVDQGFELFDYQSLLLRQLISIRSVELVNNFNLLFIKKRITMMTKNKSGLTAKLKALLVIPTAVAVFMIFANLTIKSPAINVTNFGTEKTSNLDGIWQNTNANSYGSLICFEGNKLSVLESSDKVDVVELSIIIKDKEFVITHNNKSQGSLKYEFVNNKLKIWWSESQYSLYNKTAFKNSQEALVAKKFTNIKLPKAKETRVLDKLNLTFNIYVYPNKYYVDEEECTLNNLEKVIKTRIAKFTVIEQPIITAKIYADNSIKMKIIQDLQIVLRKLNLLKVTFATIPDNNTSKLQYHSSGIIQKLPPADKAKLRLLDSDKANIPVITLHPTDNLEKAKTDFKNFVIANPNYIASLELSDNTLFSDYIAITDMTYNVIFDLRDKYAMEKYSVKYQDLPAKLQAEVRSKYPLRISQQEK